MTPVIDMTIPRMIEFIISIGTAFVLLIGYILKMAFSIQNLHTLYNETKEEISSLRSEIYELKKDNEEIKKDNNRQSQSIARIESSLSHITPQIDKIMHYLMERKK